MFVSCFRDCIGCLKQCYNWIKPPLVTSFFIVLITLVYAIQCLFQYIWPNQFIGHLMEIGCFWTNRFINGPKIFWLTFVSTHFLHRDNVHIILNIYNILVIFPENEKTLGSVTMFIITVLSIIPIGVIVIIISYTFDGLTIGDLRIVSYDECTVGFSAIIYLHSVVYVVISCQPEKGEDPRCFCAFKILWCTISILLDMFIPYLWPSLNVSFQAHFAGIIVGILYCLGFPGFKAIRNKWIEKIQLSPYLRCCRKRDGFAIIPYFDERLEIEYQLNRNVMIACCGDLKYEFDGNKLLWTLIDMDENGETKNN